MVMCSLKVEARIGKWAGKAEASVGHVKPMSLSNQQLRCTQQLLEHRFCRILFYASEDKSSNTERGFCSHFWGRKTKGLKQRREIMSHSSLTKQTKG